MTYEFDGKQYKKASAHQTSWGERMVELLPLKGTELVLDIGCGDGRVAEKIALRVHPFPGIFQRLFYRQHDSGGHFLMVGFSLLLCGFGNWMVLDKVAAKSNEYNGTVLILQFR